MVDGDEAGIAVGGRAAGLATDVTMTVPWVFLLLGVRSMLPVDLAPMTAFFAGSYGPFSSWSAMPLFAETQPITNPTPDMPPLTPL